MRLRFSNNKAGTFSGRNVGILQTLYYFYYPGLWETFFTLIGYQPVLSGKTSRETIDVAGRISEPEHCLPVKLFDAHLEDLAERVDFIFVPRMLSSLEGHIACPKLGALPDVAAVRVNTGILTIDIDERQAPLQVTLERLARRLHTPRKEARKAAKKALMAYQQSVDSIKQNNNMEKRAGGKDRFLIIGHPYLLYDDYIAGRIFKKLVAQSIDAVPMTFQAIGLPDHFIKWDTAGKMYHQIMSLGNGDYQGIIQLSAFNCGCDSIMLDIFREAVMQKGLPYLVLMLDEHTSPGGIDTRIEAFVDSVNWRNRGIS